ncbi:MAG: hypothetical protein ACOX5K_05110 [Bacteroidales bacterium]|jgi:hypothetical protein
MKRTETEFENQWNRNFAPLTNEVMPCYDNFRISERMLEDYLDIFRGYNSREGNIDMPYDHPFFDKNGNSLLKKKPCIRYILVGEARPSPKKSVYNECKPIPGDEKNGYFYDIRHINSWQPWLSAPRKNWECPSFRPCPNNKVQTLLCLASKGVLLLDLFPYAISYSTKLRNKLNRNGTTRLFWDNPTNPFNLKDRIQRIGNLLCNDWDLSLVAPCVISGHIINGFPPIIFSSSVVIPAGLHPAQFKTSRPNASRCSLGADLRKVAVSSAGTPTQNLIYDSF